MMKNIIGSLFVILFLGGCLSFPDRKPKVHLVEIKDMKFVPEHVLVEVGDTVRWINRDMVNHDVTEEASHAWTSSAILSGATWDLIVEDSVSYYCSLHLIMKGKIEVN